MKQTSGSTSLLVVKDHHLLTGLRIIIVEKLSSKELYSLLISAIDHQPTSQKYFDNLFPNIELPWKEIYLTARERLLTVTCVGSCIKLLIMCFIWLRSFFSSVSSFVFFCHIQPETTHHVFRKCLVTKILWNQPFFLRQNLIFLI